MKTILSCHLEGEHARDLGNLQRKKENFMNARDMYPTEVGVVYVWQGEDVMMHI